MKSLLIPALFLCAGCAAERVTSPAQPAPKASQTSPTPTPARDVSVTPAAAGVTLAGEWLYKDPDQSCRYVFSSDGTFTGEVTQGGESLSRFRGKWAIVGNSLLYEYVDDELGRIPPGTKDRDKLLKTSGEEFVIEASDGSQRTYRRIR